MVRIPMFCQVVFNGCEPGNLFFFGGGRDEFGGEEVERWHDSLMFLGNAMCWFTFEWFELTNIGQVSSEQS